MNNEKEDSPSKSAHIGNEIDTWWIWQTCQLFQVVTWIIGSKSDSWLFFDTVYPDNPDQNGGVFSKMPNSNF